MTRATIIKMLASSNNERERRAAQCLLAMFEERTEDFEILAQMYLAADPIPESAKL